MQHFLKVLRMSKVAILVKVLLSCQLAFGLTVSSYGNVTDLERIEDKVKDRSPRGKLVNDVIDFSNDCND